MRCWRSRQRRARAFGVICHPHPLYGGALENKVVHTLARSFQATRMRRRCASTFAVSAEARANFAEGIGETADALAVVGGGAPRWPGLPLWLAGFSFGGAVAVARSASSPRAWLVTVAPAVRLVDIE